MQILENPIWNALNTGNKHLSSGAGSVQFYPAEVTTFVGLEHFSREEYLALYDMMPEGSIRATFIPDDHRPPSPWIAAGGLEIFQLIYQGPPAASYADMSSRGAHIVKLGDQHIREMLALTKLTNPGPFNHRTIDFGHYYGIFEENKLVAMAGQRLKPQPYVEISAVCSHPDCRGKGYAKKLLIWQLQLIQKDGLIPFLHVKTDNTSAIGLYESLGFVINRKLTVSVFKK